MNRRNFMKMVGVAAVGAVLPLPAVAAGAPAVLTDIHERWLREEMERTKPFYGEVFFKGIPLIYRMSLEGNTVGIWEIPPTQFYKEPT